MNPIKKPMVINIKMDKAILEKLDDFRFMHRFENRSDGLHWLLHWALDQRPMPTEKD